MSLKVHHTSDPVLRACRRKPGYRKAVNPLDGVLLLEYLRNKLPTYAKKYLEPAFEDYEQLAAGLLVTFTPNELRGFVALCAYWIGLPNPAYRNIIEPVWSHNPGILVGTAGGNISQVRRMIAAAAFPIPLSGAVTIYRGVSNSDPAKAVKGLAWTTLHDVACWFACVGPRSGADSLVLKATVDASEFIYWSNDRFENEVILRRPPIAEIDGHSERWQQVAAHWGEEMRRRDKRLIDKFHQDKG